MSGLTLTVAPGSFRIAGQEHVLAEPQEYELVDVSERRILDGHLVLTEQGQVALLVDDRSASEVPYRFELDQPYTWITRLFYCLEVPADTTDLAVVPVYVYRIRPEVPSDG